MLVYQQKLSKAYALDQGKNYDIKSFNYCFCCFWLNYDDCQ